LYFIQENTFNISVKKNLSTIENYSEKKGSNSLPFLLLVIPVKTGIHCF